MGGGMGSGRLRLVSCLSALYTDGYLPVGIQYDQTIDPHDACT